MAIKNINNIKANEILGEDIIINDVLVATKGTPISEQLIMFLKNRDINDINILSEKVSSIQNNVKTSVQGPKLPFSSREIETTFWQTLSLLNNVQRYGGILKREEDIEYLIKIFDNMHTKNNFINIIYALKYWSLDVFVHSFDTFILGTMLAKKHEIPNIESVALGYLFHDIGKLKVYRELLDKKTKLTYIEFEMIKQHTIEGETILQSFNQGHIAHFARSHHERINGSGYPDRLTKEELSTDLRILHIVDVYSALTLKRPYRDAISSREALQIMLRDQHLYDRDLLFSFIESLKP
ncbi:HD domain-containing phosphohydrolase [Bacillus sp. FJAT-50079]|uniref:HD-GYP domain-containing protein n=1 Tax=Bacillus sp. FJAT-50079 TaxID=2833577 RepID=UPI001BC8E602|nr:HD domain-containing protein [Bacillus sp. FJAT-50079]